MATLHVVVLSVLILIISSVAQNPPVACINNGHACITGTRVLATDVDEAFEAFYGIPYAQPPTGNLRFANPIPFGNWFGNISATQLKERCIQKFILFQNANVTGVEDCLYLNVYRPIIDSSVTRLPVIVWIHGGGLFGGSATDDGPQLFLNTKEVIWVSMAYRLGALGFLSTGDEFCPGNFGFKDQSMALRWVRENIDAFGGNASSITLMEVSAGAASVHLHMMSPLSQGLFDHAIVMSGSSLAPYIEPVIDPLEQAMEQGAILGINAFNSPHLITELRGLDAYTIVDNIEGMKLWDIDPLTTYKAVIEPNITGAFIVEHPHTMSINGNYQHIPWITGVVEHEGAVRAASIVTNQSLLNDLNTQLDELLPLLMEIKIQNEDNVEQIVQRLKDKYFNGSDTIAPEYEQGFIDMYSDRAFLHPYYKMIDHYTKHTDTNRIPLGLYRFAYQGSYSYSYFITGSTRDFGVVHLDDTLYMFRSPIPFPTNNTFYNEVTSKLIEFYVSFAKTGRPPVLNDHDFVRQCTLFTMLDGGFCDYTTFNNAVDGNSLAIGIRNEFDVEVIQFWDEIFEIAEQQHAGSSSTQLSIAFSIFIFVIYNIKSSVY